MFKTIQLRAFLALTLLLSSVTISATSWLEKGNYDYSWYKPSETTFVISTPQQLAGIAYLVNNGYTDFAGKTITLENDIDLTAYSWKGIGEDSKPFKGKLEGNHKIITLGTIRYETGAYPNYGFFNAMLNSTISNLHIKSSINLDFNHDYYCDTNCGILAGKADKCNFINCSTSGNISYNRNKTNNFKYALQLGGLIGYSYQNNFQYCSHEGDIEVHFDSESMFYNDKSYLYIGGICGYCFENNLEYCSNKSTSFRVVAGSSKNSSNLPISIGGIIGYASSSSKFLACHNDTYLFQTELGGWNYKTLIGSVGGIVGSFTIYLADKGYMINCYSSTYAFRSNGSPVKYGGLIGFGNPSTAPEKYAANFSPSNIQSSNSYSTNSYGYNGNTAYNSGEMKSQDFIDELNLYPLLNGLDYKWVMGNPYPEVLNIYDSGVETVKTDNLEKCKLRIVEKRIIFDSVGDIKVYDTIGVLKYQGRSNKTDILSPGIYIVSFNGMACKVMI